MTLNFGRGLSKDKNAAANEALPGWALHESVCPLKAGDTVPLRRDLEWWLARTGGEGEASARLNSNQGKKNNIDIRPLRPLFPDGPSERQSGQEQPYPGRFAR